MEIVSTFQRHGAEWNAFTVSVQMVMVKVKKATVAELGRGRQWVVRHDFGGLK